MMERIWTAYQMEIVKAVRLRFTYVGPCLVALMALIMPLAHSITRNGPSGYAFIAYVTPVTLNLLGLLLVLTFCGGLMSSELSSGAICTVLVRPLRRTEFLVAKLLFGMTYALSLTVTVAAVSWLLAFLFGSLAGITYGGETVYIARDMSLAYLVAFGLSLCPQAAAVAFALMMSTVTRSTGAAVGGAIGAWVVVDAIKYPLHIDRMVFSTYLDGPWQVFADRCNGLATPWMPLATYCIISSACAFAVFVVVAGWALKRRNLRA